eukprot:scpid109869/ scgid6095/ 
MDAPNSAPADGDDPEDGSDLEGRAVQGVGDVQDDGAVKECQKTPLHHAAATRFTSRSVELLLSRGGDPNARDERQKTPLHHAVATWFPGRNVELLLSSGADP